MGIYVDSDLDRLYVTLTSLRVNGHHQASLLLLVDGLNAQLESKLTASFADYPQSITAVSRGAPACFNRLLQENADLYVYLESGVMVGHGWLQSLLACLEADPQNGLAGPSTNRSWNEQRVFPHCQGNQADVNRNAKKARQRYGKTWQPLTPLYSLADFCYVVKRDVVRTIGGADEAYGQGPCWEMDYNIRAARAGFQGIWAKGAFVYRPPFSRQRQQNERQRFSTNKRLYQSRFCGRQLQAEGQPYKMHCRGDVCQHFAPGDLIELKRPLNSSNLSPPPSPSQNPVVSLPQKPPLVSCIMPTRDRLSFVLQSIQYFLKQDYSEKELIIVDDSHEDIRHHLPADPRIQVVRTQPGQTIGAKRNIACRSANGRFIAHWDDDDWYSPHRLRTQLSPLLAGEAHISGLRDTLYCDLPAWRFWRCTADLHSRLFMEDVHGGTLLYEKRVWEHYSKFPNQSLAEDAVFLRRAVRKGASISRIENNGLFIYMRHGQNSWSFSCGQYLDPNGWYQVPAPQLSPADKLFYTQYSSRRQKQVQALSQKQGARPLVSCIMPTANRRPFVLQAIRYFQRQTYPNIELVIVDDGHDAISDVVPSDPRIQYHRLSGKHTIGAKRNFACEKASGEIIVHWDDDDWMAPWRISYQVDGLLQNRADITGIDQIFYFNPGVNKAWKYVYPTTARPWVAGNTLCFRRQVWLDNPFANINVGEDTRFIWSSQVKKIVRLDNTSFFVGLIHDTNVSFKRSEGSRWQRIPIEEMSVIMGNDIESYLPRIVQNGG